METFDCLLLHDKIMKSANVWITLLHASIGKELRRDSVNIIFILFTISIQYQI